MLTDTKKEEPKNKETSEGKVNSTALAHMKNLLREAEKAPKKGAVKKPSEKVQKPSKAEKPIEKKPV
jgi:hypothetical protein